MIESSTLPPEDLHKVKVNPALARIRKMLLGGAIVFLVCLLLLFVPLVNLRTNTVVMLDSTYYGTFALLAFVSLVVTLLLMFQSGPALKQLERKRQHAAQGDRQFLADTQPTPNEQALVLPLTIELRYQRSAHLKITGIFLLLIIISTIFIFLPIFNWTDALLKSVFIMLDVLCIFYLGLLFLVARNPTGRITITQDELSIMGSPSKTYRVAWKDARLFAIDSLTTRNRSLQLRHPLVFEVASADALVRIMWLRPDAARRYPLQPLTSYEEYERQMHCLLSVIAAKTGLPLYDLRKS